MIIRDNLGSTLSEIKSDKTSKDGLASHIKDLNIRKGRDVTMSK